MLCLLPSRAKYSALCERLLADDSESCRTQCSVSQLAHNVNSFESLRHVQLIR